jgi:adenylate cyclase
MAKHGYLIPLEGGDPIPLARDTLVVGRRDGSDIRLPHPNVSSRHAELRLNPKGFWTIEDLESSNGTKVNGDKISAKRKKKIYTGDELTFARRHRYRLELDPSFQPPPPDEPEAEEAPAAAAPVEEDSSFRRSLLEKAGLTKRKVEELPLPQEEPDRRVDAEADIRRRPKGK